MHSETKQAGFDLAKQFVHLSHDVGAKGVLVNDSVRSQADNRKETSSGRLMGAIRMIRDPDHWEMHPDGDQYSTTRVSRYRQSGNGNIFLLLLR